MTQRPSTHQQEASPDLARARKSRIRSPLMEAAAAVSVRSTRRLLRDFLHYSPSHGLPNRTSWHNNTRRVCDAREEGSADFLSLRARTLQLEATVPKRHPLQAASTSWKQAPLWCSAASGEARLVARRRLLGKKSSAAHSAPRANSPSQPSSTGVKNVHKTTARRISSASRRLRVVAELSLVFFPNRLAYGLVATDAAEKSRARRGYVGLNMFALANAEARLYPPLESLCIAGGAVWPRNVVVAVLARLARTDNRAERLCRGGPPAFARAVVTPQATPTCGATSPCVRARR